MFAATLQNYYRAFLLQEKNSCFLNECMIVCMYDNVHILYKESIIYKSFLCQVSPAKSISNKTQSLQIQENKLEDF